MHAPFPSAWVYRRGPDVVCIEVQALEGRYQLTVRGPGSRTLSQRLDDALAVIEAQLGHEAHLLAQGYVFSGFADQR